LPPVAGDARTRAAPEAMEETTMEKITSADGTTLFAAEISRG
jgi:hypothetical protein